MNPHHHAAYGFLAAAMGYGGMLGLQQVSLTKQERLLQRLDRAETRYTARQAQRLRDAPIINAAEAKRERKRLKRMRDHD